MLTHYSLILWPVIDPILVTFGQICNLRDPKLVTFYIYKLTHFLNWMKNTLLFTYSTNILVRLLTVNKKHCLTPQKSDNVQPHYSQSNPNVTPSSERKHFKSLPFHIDTWSLKKPSYTLICCVDFEMAFFHTFQFGKLPYEHAYSE